MRAMVSMWERVCECEGEGVCVWGRGYECERGCECWRGCECERLGVSVGEGVSVSDWV